MKAATPMQTATLHHRTEWHGAVNHVIVVSESQPYNGGDQNRPRRTRRANQVPHIDARTRFMRKNIGFCAIFHPHQHHLDEAMRRRSPLIALQFHLLSSHLYCLHFSIFFTSLLSSLFLHVSTVFASLLSSHLGFLRISIVFTLSSLFETRITELRLLNFPLLNIAPMHIVLFNAHRILPTDGLDYKQSFRAESGVPPFHEVQTLGEDPPNSAGADHFRSDEARQSM